jgi:hypothetical protein
MNALMFLIIALFACWILKRTIYFLVLLSPAMKTRNGDSVSSNSVAFISIWIWLSRVVTQAVACSLVQASLVKRILSLVQASLVKRILSLVQASLVKRILSLVQASGITRHKSRLKGQTRKDFSRIRVELCFQTLLRNSVIVETTVT